MSVTRAKDVLLNTNHTQAAEITPASNGMIPSAAAWRCLQRARYNASCSRTDHSFAAGGWRECTARFNPGDLDLWPLTVTFKLAQARDQTRLPGEFGINPFSHSRFIWCTNKQKRKSHRQR